MTGGAGRSQREDSYNTGDQKRRDDGAEVDRLLGKGKRWW